MSSVTMAWRSCLTVFIWSAVKTSVTAAIGLVSNTSRIHQVICLVCCTSAFSWVTASHYTVNVILCTLYWCSLQCFDTVDWVTGRASSEQKVGCWFVGGDDLTGALHVYSSSCYHHLHHSNKIQSGVETFWYQLTQVHLEKWLLECWPSLLSDFLKWLAKLTVVQRCWQWLPLPPLLCFCSLFNWPVSSVDHSRLSMSPKGLSPKKNLLELLVQDILQARWSSCHQTNSVRTLKIEIIVIVSEKTENKFNDLSKCTALFLEYFSIKIGLNGSHTCGQCNVDFTAVLRKCTLKSTSSLKKTWTPVTCWPSLILVHCQ